MKVDVRPRKRNAPRIAEKSAPGFLQWLRGRECLYVSRYCGGKSEAMHVDYAGDKGIATKVSDRYAVPGCARHHALQHAMGWPAFEDEVWMKRGGSLAAAEGYWRAWPGRIAWERKLEEAK